MMAISLRIARTSRTRVRGDALTFSGQTMKTFTAPRKKIGTPSSSLLDAADRDGWVTLHLCAARQSVASQLRPPISKPLINMSNTD
jgi:hypothetical protein